MKKLLFLFFVSLIFLSDIYAQIDLGFYAGLDNSKLSGDQYINTKYKSKLGFLIGFSIDPHINDIISLSFQPGFLKRGSRIQVPDTIENEYKDSVKISINYIQLPIYIKIQSKSKRVYFYSGFGLGYGISLKADNEIEELDLTDEMKKFSLSLDFGFGYKIPIKKSILYLELRYSQGLLNVANPGEDDDDYIPRVKMSGFKFVTGFQIPVTKRNKTKI